jgi:hypothetical protein
MSSAKKRKWVAPAAFTETHELSTLETSGSLQHLLGFLELKNAVALIRTSRYARTRMMKWFVGRVRYRFESMLPDTLSMVKHVDFPKRVSPEQLSTVVPRLTSASLHNEADFTNPMWTNLKQLVLFASSSPSLTALPPNLQKLRTSNEFRSQLPPLPLSLQKLSTGACYSRPLALNTQLKFLTILGSTFNYPLGPLPETLEYLQVSGAFNCPLFNFLGLQMLPSGLVMLVMSRAFNHSLGSLPTTLEVLRMGSQFDCKLEQLPPSLKSLRINGVYDHDLGPLPLLRELVLGDKFSQTISLPDGLKRLTLGCRSVISGNLPTSLEYLELGCRAQVNLEALHLKSLRVLGSVYKFRLGILNTSLKSLTLVDFIYCIDALPRNLIELDVTSSNTLPALPDSLKRLCISGMYNSRLGILGPNLRVLDICSDNFEQPLGVLPDSLKILRFRNAKQPLQNLPGGLRTLQLGDLFAFPLPKLPIYLRTLILGNSFNQSLGELPRSLVSLRLGNCFDFPLGTFGKNLATLELGHSFNHQIVLPANLTSLTLGNSFEHNLGLLPPALKVLHVGQAFNHVVKVPKSVTSLRLGIGYSHQLALYPGLNPMWHHPNWFMRNPSSNR